MSLWDKAEELGFAGLALGIAKEQIGLIATVMFGIALVVAMRRLWKASTQAGDPRARTLARYMTLALVVWLVVGNTAGGASPVSFPFEKLYLFYTLLGVAAASRRWSAVAEPAEVASDASPPGRPSERAAVRGRT